VRAPPSSRLRARLAVGSAASGLDLIDPRVDNKIKTKTKTKQVVF
jgi:hypothetical protein